MRVLLVHAFYRLAGGEDRYVGELERVLRTRHDVHLYAAHNAELGSGPSAAAVMFRGVKAKRELTDVIRSFEPDLIHVHNTYPALGPAPFLVARELGIPLVMTLHNYRLRCPNGYFFTHDGICTRCESGNYLNAVAHNCLPTRTQSVAYASSLWLHRFGLRVEDAVSRFVAPSRFLAKRMTEAGIPEDRLSIVPNFAYRNAGLSRHQMHGLYADRLSFEKGLDVLIRALQVAGNPPFKIMGIGPEEQMLRREAVSRGLSNTEFMGQVSPEVVRKELSRARFLVVPSVCYENAPLISMEALAAGCPLIVSDGGGLPEIVAGGAGITFPMGDATALGRTLQLALQDDDLVQQMGGRARRAFEEEFTPNRHLERLEQVYGLATATGGTRMNP